MDIIDIAIEKGRDVCQNSQYASQTWRNFERMCENKKVFLFGSGACAGVYWNRYQGNVKLDGVIDNDKKKQGRTIGDYLPEAFAKSGADLIIAPITKLEEYDFKDIVVLVASTKYYEEIIQQLNAMGIENVFILLIMEANLRKKENRVRTATKNKHTEMDFFVRECWNYPIEQKKIVFQSFGTYCDHCKYITEQLLKLRNDLDIVWIVNNLQKQVPKGIRLVWSSNWKKYIYELETAHIIVFNTVIKDYISKRENQIYIHTKHWASITLKKFYLDASTITDVPRDVAFWKRMGNNLDYMIVGSDFDEASCRRGFNFQKDFIRVGSPRTDAMFQEETLKNKVYKHFKIDKTRKMLLYAPTYRYNPEIKQSHVAESRNIELDYGRIKHVFEERFGDEWVIGLRLHPSVTAASREMILPDYVIDMSAYEDSEELCAACNVLISDYSSIMFEPAFVRKPVFLFATDKKKYIDREYDLLIDYETLPFPVAESNEELAECVWKFDLKQYEQEVDAFMNKYGIHEDGHASERAAKVISALISREMTESK